jgi:hypothetical protein
VILSHLLDVNTTAEVWASINSMFKTASVTKARHLRDEPNDAKKLTMTADHYFTKMKGLASELSALGKPVEDDELLGYLLHGLDKAEYNPLITSVNGNPSTSLDEFYEQCALLTCTTMSRRMVPSYPQQIWHVMELNMTSVPVAERLLLVAAALNVLSIVEVVVATVMMTVETGDVMMLTMETGDVMIAVVIVVTDVMVAMIAAIILMEVDVALIALLLPMSTLAMIAAIIQMRYARNVAILQGECWWRYGDDKKTKDDDEKWRGLSPAMPMLKGFRSRERIGNLANSTAIRQKQKNTGVYPGLAPLVG